MRSGYPYTCTVAATEGGVSMRSGYPYTRTVAVTEGGVDGMRYELTFFPACSSWARVPSVSAGTAASTRRTASCAPM